MKLTRAKLVVNATQATCIACSREARDLVLELADAVGAEERVGARAVGALLVLQKVCAQLLNLRLERGAARVELVASTARTHERLVGARAIRGQLRLGGVQRALHSAAFHVPLAARRFVTRVQSVLLGGQPRVLLAAAQAQICEQTCEQTMYLWFAIRVVVNVRYRECLNRVGTCPNFNL